MFRLRSKKPIQAPAEIAGIRVRVSPRARRMALRLDIKAGDIVLTWPRGASESTALRFIEENRRWIETRRQKIPAPQIFAHGEKISIYGEECTITHKTGRGVTRLEGKDLIVHGRPEHLPRRIRDFLKQTARQVLEDRAAQKLEQIGRAPSDIRVIDPKTRWGSCSPDGSMMFSWRLILAPPGVLDYVVAHEVAHCIHMNHSKKFWALCASLTENAAASRRWLKAHGATVMAYR
ncbi:MAG: M48 family metallopeptidase [Alphaproteobacteria bacterium]|nr:M48 family metallopeptidase [Alphaproteobacteria bacterium]